MIRTAGNERYRAPGRPVAVSPLQFVIADEKTLAVAAISPKTPATYSQASALLAGAATRCLMIVAAHEAVT